MALPWGDLPSPSRSQACLISYFKSTCLNTEQHLEPWSIITKTHFESTHTGHQGNRHTQVTSIVAIPHAAHPTSHSFPTHRFCGGKCDSMKSTMRIDTSQHMDRADVLISASFRKWQRNMPQSNSLVLRALFSLSIICEETYFAS